MAYTKTDCEQRIKDMKAEHQAYLPAYRELSDYINPFRGLFNGDRTKIGKMIDHKRLISSYSTNALKIFASGLNSGMTNKSTQWFNIELEDMSYLEVPGVRQWLDDVQARMYMVINGSNIYDAFYSTYEELGQFGTGCYIILPDDKDIIRARSFTAGEYYIATDNKGRVNAFGREFEMTIAQLVKEFGLESCSDGVKSKFEANQKEIKIKVSHLIDENVGRNTESDDNENMEFKSVYWEQGHSEEKFLRKSGFKKFPVVCPRWETVSTDTLYGYGPGWHAIGSIKELQKTRKDKLIAQEKSHTPPTIQDASVDGHANLLPGGVTRISGNVPNSGVRAAYQINPNFDSFIQLLDEEKEEIDRFFFVNLFLMMLNIDRSNVTATEIAERQQEKIMMMGPALHRTDDEMLSPTLEIIFSDMEEVGLIPEPPPEIAGVNLKIKYTSVLAQAQQAVGISKIERVFGFAGNTAQVRPDILDNLDVDEAIRLVNNFEGAPSKIIKDKLLVMQERKQKDQMMKAQQATEMAATGAKAVKDLSGAPLGQGNAMDGVLAGMGAMQR